MAKVRPIKRTLADIPSEVRPAAERERADFEHVYQTLVAAFDLGKPDARTRTRDVRRAYVTILRQIKTVPEPSRRQLATLIQMEDRLARLGDLLNRTRRRRSASTDHGPTPETVVQQDRALSEVSLFAHAREGEDFRRSSYGDSLNRLAANKVIDRDEVKAGRQIASIFEAVTRGMGAKAGKLEPGAGGGTWRMSDRLAVLHQDRYRPWAEKVMQAAGAPALMLAIAVAVDGESLRRAARRQRMGYDRAKGLIKMALRLYVAETAATRYAEDEDYLAERIGVEELAVLEERAKPGPA